MKLVLASASPRRRDLLRAHGVVPLVVPAEVDESVFPDELPAAHVGRLAAAKARTVAPRFPGDFVLGADTVVVLGDRILGKPVSLTEAREFLQALSGRTHNVLTGVCIRREEPPFERAWVSRTAVTFKRLDTAVIDVYCSVVDVLDKAGAYAIQEHGDMLVDRIDGSWSNVVGLPVEDVLAVLQGLRGTT